LVAMETLVFWVLLQYRVDTHERLQTGSHVYSSREYCEADKEVLIVDNKTYAICQRYGLEN